ncbi:hypothetical protein pEaSNUABM38_00192 [Erwinia phage pEa_SNUABM_38]|nr:hypothetical protein pEaSNUABM38_00192 [Erwinia phage pEa_SNUABM_38]
MQVVMSYELSKLNVAFRNRLMKHLITRYFEENKIPDTWAEEKETIVDELDIPAQLIISRLFGGWLDAAINCANSGDPVFSPESLVEYPHNIDDLYDMYSFESEKEYHRDFSGYMDQTAWEFMTRASEFLTEDAMLGSIHKYLVNIVVELYGTISALRGGGCAGVWHTLEQYEQQVWMGRPVLFAIYPEDYTVLHEGPKPEVFVGSEQAKATAGQGEYFFLWDGHMFTLSKIDEVPTGSVIRTCELTDEAVSWIEGNCE